MTVFLYDGSFEGLMTAVFEVYEYKIGDVSIQIVGKSNASLFGESREVKTDSQKANRVIKKLKDKLTSGAISQLYKTFLSEIAGIEDTIFRYIRYVISSKEAVENNYGHSDVLMLQQTSRKVHREKHRMEAFVRFQLTKDELYYAVIQPDFNVLPLISRHFETRYADQRWLIYDALRKYGLYYDLNTVEEVQLNFTDGTGNGKNIKQMYAEDEILYQQLWQQYFKSVNIAARKNMKLHIQHMPKRYWWLLTEKQPR